MIEDCRDTDTSCLIDEDVIEDRDTDTGCDEDVIEDKEMCKFHQKKFAAWGM